jgi:hypothetical protein
MVELWLFMKVWKCKLWGKCRGSFSPKRPTVLRNLTLGKHYHVSLSYFPFGFEMLLFRLSFPNICPLMVL